MRSYGGKTQIASFLFTHNNKAVDLVLIQVQLNLYVPFEHSNVDAYRSIHDKRSL